MERWVIININFYTNIYITLIKKLGIIRVIKFSWNIKLTVKTEITTKQ